MMMSAVMIDGAAVGMMPHPPRMRMVVLVLLHPNVDENVAHDGDDVDDASPSTSCPCPWRSSDASAVDAAMALILVLYLID